jgi:hypothetical protein
MPQHLATLQLPVPERIAKATELNLQQNKELSSMIASGAMPNWAKAMRADVETAARFRVAQAVLAVERWRLVHPGLVPESLGWLVPEYLPAIPTDPCDGQPLRFQARPRGYIVYSVGPDGVDNQGLEKPDKPEGKNYDVTMVIER